MTWSSQTALRPGRDPHRWIVFAVICAIFFFVCFQRVSISVIVSDLLAAFDTDASALGLMSAMYFYIYALNQPVVGYLADRIGPRRVIAFWTIIAGAGCWVFGMAPSIGWATAGRALIGFGVSGVYVPSVKALSEWFRQKEFGAMVGLLMSVGNLGAVAATTPLAWAAANFGWRSTFGLVGGVMLGVALLMLLGTHDCPQAPTATDRGGPPAENVSGDLGRNLITIVSSPQFWLVVTINFGIYGTAVTLQGLWATPFLMAVLGIERLFASQLNMLIPIGVIIGAPFFGWLPGRFALSKAVILTIILAVYTLGWLSLLLLASRLGIYGLAVVFGLMGAVIGGFLSTIWGIIRETTPTRRLGLTSGILNPAPFFGVAAFQVLTGNIIAEMGGVGGLPAVEGFKSAFALCAAASGLCLVLSLLVRARTAEMN